jgi:GNAT superfamily N-acetyltransferase
LLEKSNKPCLQKQPQKTTLLRMPSPVEHRTAALEARDADAVSALESACFTTAFSPEQYRRILRTPQRGGETRFLGLGLFAPGRALLAYVLVGLHRAAREAEVYNLAVHESARRRGFGSALLAGALRALDPQFLYGPKPPAYGKFPLDARQSRAYRTADLSLQGGDTADGCRQYQPGRRRTADGAGRGMKQA